MKNHMLEVPIQLHPEERHNTPAPPLHQHFIELKYFLTMKGTLAAAKYLANSTEFVFLPCEHAQVCFT